MRIAALQHHQSWIRWLLVVAVFALALTGIRNCQLQDFRYEMPEALQLGAMVGSDMDSIVLSSCGGGGFEIAASVADRLEMEGSAFLESVLLRPGYGPWRPTPAPDGWTSEGAWRGLECVRDRDVIEAAFYGLQQNGNFYSVDSSRGTIIILLPAEHMAVYTYDEFSNWPD